MIILKWIAGIIIGLAIFICLEDWEVGNNDIFNFLVVINAILNNINKLFN